MIARHSHMGVPVAAVLSVQTGRPFFLASLLHSQSYEVAPHAHFIILIISA